MGGELSYRMFLKNVDTNSRTDLLLQSKGTSGAVQIGSPATPGSISGLPIFTLPNGKLVRCGVDKQMFMDILNICHLHGHIG